MVRIYDPIGNNKLLHGPKIRYYTAITHSNVHSTGIYESHDYLEILNYSREHAYSFYYEPLNINVKTHVEVYSTDIPYHFVERWGIPIKPINVFYDYFTTKIIRIQRWWKRVFIRRKIARFVICRHVYRALLNPYTELGKNRLLRLFFKM
jgi:hypothetical protein